MHDRAVVRVWRDTAVVGGGFLAARGIVLTCAHVVAKALAIGDGPPPDGAVVEIDFPLAASGRRLPAHIRRWRPSGHDVAVLALAAENLPDVAPASLVAMPAAAGTPLCRSRLSQKVQRWPA